MTTDYISSAVLAVPLFTYLFFFSVAYDSPVRLLGGPGTRSGGIDAGRSPDLLGPLFSLDKPVRMTP